SVVVSHTESRDLNTVPVSAIGISQEQELSNFLSNTGLIAPSVIDNVHASSSVSAPDDQYNLSAADSHANQHPEGVYGSLMIEEQARSEKPPSKIKTNASFDGVMEFSNEDGKMNSRLDDDISQGQLLSAAPVIVLAICHRRV